jgi:hypothetical protein
LPALMCGEVLRALPRSSASSLLNSSGEDCRGSGGLVAQRRDR